MDQEEHKKVIDWLEECDRTKKEPWLWDFKNCYKVPPSKDSEPKDSKPKDLLSEDSITAFLKYKNGEFKDNTSDFNITEKAGFDADCDKEAIELYKVLGWQNSATAITRGETMNSFLTTFNRAIRKSSNYNTLTKELGINNIKDYYSIPDQPNKNNQPQVPNYQRFDIIKPNLPAFQTFATLTHTIGNFTVLLYWINTARNNFSKDYWDITLLSLQEWLAPTTPTSKAWINFVEMFYLQPYVNKDYQTQLFWENHGYSYKNIYPDKQDFPVFLKAVNERIEERGKYMIKQICDRLNRTDFNFYKEIRDMDKIRFSDEF